MNVDATNASEREQEEELPGTIVTLEAYLDLGCAAGLRESLLEALDVEGQLTINGEGVECITTPCVQVLLSAGKSLALNGKSLRLEKASPALTSAFADLGLNHKQLWSSSQ